MSENRTASGGGAGGRCSAEAEEETQEGEGLQGPRRGRAVAHTPPIHPHRSFTGMEGKNITL